jgi:hypothetical protein
MNVLPRVADDEASTDDLIAAIKAVTEVNAKIREGLAEAAGRREKPT